MTTLRSTLALATLLVGIDPASAGDADADWTTGQRLFAKGEWSAAAKALTLVAPRLANAKKRSLAYRQLGLAQFELALLPAAEESFSLSLAADPLADLNPAQDAPAAVALFRTVRSRLDGTLVVTTDQPARVFVDGVDRGAAPATIKASIGAHHVRAATPDGRHAVERSDVVVFVGKTAEFRLVLKPLVAFLDVTGPAGFAIALDGAHLGQTPAQNLAITPGKRIVTFSAPGFDPKVVPLDLSAGDRRTIDGSLQKSAGPNNVPTPPRPPPRLTRPWAWLTAGVGAIAAGIGTALLLTADSLADHDSSKLPRRDAGIGLMAGGAVTGVASAILFILHRDR